MYRYLLIVVLLLQACTTVEVGGKLATVKKVDDTRFLLRMTIRGLRSDAAIEEEASIHADYLCQGAEFETEQVVSETRSNMVMVNGMFVDTYYDEVTLQITCLEERNRDLIYLGHGEDIDKPDGFSRLRIYNSTNKLLYTNKSGAIYVELNNTLVVKLPPRQYLDIFVRNGVKTVGLTHIDAFTFTGATEFEMVGNDVILDVWASPVGTKSKVVTELPDNFTRKYIPYLVAGP